MNEAFLEYMLLRDVDTYNVYKHTHTHKHKYTQTTHTQTYSYTIHTFFSWQEPPREDAVPACFLFLHSINSSRFELSEAVVRYRLFLLFYFIVYSRSSCNEYQ